MRCKKTRTYVLKIDEIDVEIDADVLIDTEKSPQMVKIDIKTVSIVDQEWFRRMEAEMMEAFKDAIVLELLPNTAE